MAKKNNLPVPIARDEMDDAVFNEMMALGLNEPQEDQSCPAKNVFINLSDSLNSKEAPVFQSTLSMDEIERNFEGFDIFSELMSALGESLEHSKGGTDGSEGSPYRDIK